MTTVGPKSWWGGSGLLVLVLSAGLVADDALPTPLEPAPAGQAGAVAPNDLPPDATTPQPTPAGGASYFGGASGIVEPVPIGSAGCASCGYGWGAGYAPTYTGQYGYPGSWNGYWNYGTAYGAPGYTGYWHGWYAGPTYASGWGWEGAYGCGYRGRAYWDYAWPTYSHHGWGYGFGNIGWGWGHGHYYYPWGYSPGYGRWGMIHRW